MKEGGRVATPTSFSIFDSYDMKSVWFKFGHDIFTGFKIKVFKVGMRNSQYEIRSYQKSHNKVTMTVYVWFDFSNQNNESTLLHKVLRGYFFTSFRG